VKLAAVRKLGLLRRHVALIVLLAAIVFGTLIIYGDLPNLSRSLRQFPLNYLAIVLALALANYLIRWVRWLYYLRTLNINLEASHNFLIFFSGLSMSISPGKIGELAKSYLLSETNQVPVSKSSPAVIMERVTDLVAVFALSVLGLTALPGQLVLIGGLAVAAVAAVLAATLIFSRGLLLRLPIIKRWETQILDSRESFKRLLSIKAILIGLALAVLAWLAEGFGLWLVLQGLDTPLSPLHAISIYATASLVGALTMLPGGIIGTEGSMVGLLRGLDLTRTDASAATIIIRLCTLWFAVLLGLVALGLFYWLVQRAKPRLTEAGVD
jgi:uncharacterized membrane protein YbhN (UPF0104 family)